LSAFAEIAPMKIANRVTPPSQAGISEM